MIPKIIHFIWWQGEVPAAKRANLDQWKLLNPKWEIRVWNGEQLQALIREAFPRLSSAFKRIPDTSAKGKFREIRKADCARLFVMHLYGGVYLDLDLVPFRPLDAFLRDKEIYLRRFTRFDANEPVTTADLARDCSYIAPGGFNYIVFRDTQPMDATGNAVINGVMFSRAHEPGQDSWLLDFARAQLTWGNRRKPVLDAFGSYALARFLRDLRARELGEDILHMPGHYVIWYNDMFGPTRWFVLCTHDGATSASSWGDDSKQQPWKETK